MSILAQTIVCIAQKYLGRKESPAGSNRGSDIETFQAPFGLVGYAWCSMFAWFVVQEATALLDCMNVLPKTAGAKDMLNKARKIPNLVTDFPAVGCVFYRKSFEGLQEGDGTTPTGHIGIVTAVTETSIETIEGNRLDSVASAKYTVRELADSSLEWAFIHVQNTQCSATAMPESCRNVQITQTAIRTFEREAEPPVVKVTLDTKSELLALDAHEKGAINKIKDPCYDIPASEAVPHYSWLYMPQVAGDIVGAGDSLYRLTNTKRVNGIALDSPGAGRYSGFAIVTDALGNMYIIVPEWTEAYKAFDKGQLFGQNSFYTYTFGTSEGDGWKEAAAGTIMGSTGLQTYFGKSGIEINGHPANSVEMYSHGTIQINHVIPSLKIRYTRVTDLIQAIERNGQKVDRPIICLMKHSATTLRNIIKEVIKVATPFLQTMLPGFPIARITDTILAIAEGNINPIQLIGAAVEIAQGISPKFVQSTLQEIEKVKKTFKDSVDYVTGDITQAVKDLGLSAQNIGKDIARNIIGDIRNGSLARAVDSSLGLEEFRRKVQQLQNADIIFRLDRTSQSGTLITDIIDTGTLIANTTTQNMVLAGIAGTVLPSIPNITEIAEATVNKTFDVYSSGGHDLNLHASFMKAAQGFIAPPSSFKRLSLAALEKQIEAEIERSGINGSIARYVMPASLPDAEKYCFAEKLRKSYPKTEIIIEEAPKTRDSSTQWKIGTSSKETTSVNVPRIEFGTPTGQRDSSTSLTPGSGQTTTTNLVNPPVKDKCCEELTSRVQRLEGQLRGEFDHWAFIRKKGQVVKTQLDLTHKNADLGRWQRFLLGQQSQADVIVEQQQRRERERDVKPSVETVEREVIREIVSTLPKNEIARITALETTIRSIQESLNRSGNTSTQIQIPSGINEKLVLLERLINETRNTVETRLRQIEQNSSTNGGNSNIQVSNLTARIQELESQLLQLSNRQYTQQIVERLPQDQLARISALESMVRALESSALQSDSSVTAHMTQLENWVRDQLSTRQAQTVIQQLPNAVSDRIAALESIVAELQQRRTSSVTDGRQMVQYTSGTHAAIPSLPAVHINFRPKLNNGACCPDCESGCDCQEEQQTMQGLKLQRKEFA